MMIYCLDIRNRFLMSLSTRHHINNQHWFGLFCNTSWSLLDDFNFTFNYHLQQNVIQKINCHFLYTTIGPNYLVLFEVKQFLLHCTLTSSNNVLFLLSSKHPWHGKGLLFSKVLAHVQLSKMFWMTESNLELHKFLKVNWNLWICSSNSLLVSQNTLLKCTWSGPHIAVGYKIFEFPTLFTIAVMFFSGLSFLVLYLYVYLLISQLIFWSQFCLVSWDQLRLSIWEHLQNDRNGRINKKMSEQSVHLKAKTHSFFEDN